MIVAQVEVVFGSKLVMHPICLLWLGFCIIFPISPSHPHLHPWARLNPPFSLNHNVLRKYKLVRLLPASCNFPLDSVVPSPQGVAWRTPWEHHSELPGCKRKWEMWTPVVQGQVRFQTNLFTVQSLMVLLAQLLVTVLRPGVGGEGRNGCRSLRPTWGGAPFLLPSLYAPGNDSCRASRG